MKIKTTTKLAFTVLAALLAIPAFAGESIKFHNNFDQAAAESQRTGKPIITIFSATWCPPCQQMKKEVYPSTTIAPFHDSFVWAYLDADVAANRGLMSKYGVQGIPHIAFVAPNGKQLGKTVGAMQADAFAGVLNGVLKKVN